MGTKFHLGPCPKVERKGAKQSRRRVVMGAGRWGGGKTGQGECSDNWHRLWSPSPPGFLMQSPGFTHQKLDTVLWKTKHTPMSH